MKESPGPIWSRRFEGLREGPRLLVTAGVHGDEFLPMLVIRELIRRFDGRVALRETLRGTVTFVPVVNAPAFRLGRRCAGDGLDLARTCPGKEEGSVSEKIAFAVSQMIREADAYVDLHTGGTELSVFPLAGYVLHSDPDILDRQRAMAKAFNLPFVWGTSAELPGRTLSVARDAGVPAIYVEYLGSTRERLEPVDDHHACFTGVIRVMEHLGMLPGESVAERVEEVVEDWRPESGHMQICHPSPRTGFYRAVAGLGDRVRRGEVLAEVSPVFGGDSCPVVADRNGRIVVLRDFPRVNEGDPVAVIAENHGPS